LQQFAGVQKVNETKKVQHMSKILHFIFFIRASQRSTSAASPGALVAFVEPGSNQTGRLISRAGCNQRDEMACPLNVVVM